MSEQWFFMGNAIKHGPFSTAQLKQLAAAGMLHADDQVQKTGMQKWVAASSVKGLFPAGAARPTAAEKPHAPGGGLDLPFGTAAATPKPRRTQPPSRKAVLLGAAGGGVLLLALLVVLVVFGGRTPTRNTGEDRTAQKENGKQPAGSGNGSSNNDGNGEPTELDSQIVRTAPSHVLLLEKPARQIKGGLGGLGGMGVCAYTPDGKALIVDLKGGRTIIDATTEQVLAYKPPLSTYLSLNPAQLFVLDPNQMKAVLLPPDKQAGRLDALETAMRMKGGILGFGGTTAEYVAIRGNSQQGALEIWNLVAKSQVMLESVPLARNEAFSHFAISPDSRFFARATRKRVHVWELPSGKLSKSLDFGIGRHLMFSPDGKWLLTQQWRDEAKRNGTDQLVLWNTQDWGKKHAIKSPGRDFNLGALCAFSPDGRLLATTNDETGYIRLVTIWDVQSGKLRRGFETLEFGGLTFSPDGKLLAIWNGRLPLSIWDVESGQIKCQFPFTAHPQSFSPDGRSITLATAEGGLIYDLTKGRQVPYVDPVQKERNRLAKAIDITKPATPITKAKYDQIRVGMTRFQVMRLLGGAGETVKKDTFKRKEGKFGYSVIYRDTQKYAGTGGGHALFDYEGASTDTPLVRKQEFGLK